MKEFDWGHGKGGGGVITETGNEPLDCLSSFEKTTKDILFKFVGWGACFVGGWMNSKGEGKTYCNLPIEK
jgi:hypothetical protein